LYNLFMFDFFKNKAKKDVPKYYFYVIDDEPDVLEVIVDLIESTFPCVVKKFTKVSDALDALKKETLAPDLIYSDIKMGSESGLLLKDKVELLGHNIPILYITGLSGQEGLMNGYWSINKPVSKASLKKYTKILFEEARTRKKLN